MSRLQNIQAVFRAPFLRRVVEGTHHSSLKELKDYIPVEQLQGKPLREWFDFLYDILLEKYRCEYVYKNTLVNQLYMQGEHIPRNSTLIRELRVCYHNKADIVIINGKSTVYEIKSKYDSLDRLESQIAAYKKVFDRIYVVTCAEKIKAVEKKVGKDIGIYELKRKRLTKIREAESNKANTLPEWIFYCMHQAEYLSVLNEKFGYTPPHNVWMSRESRKMFCQLGPEEAHDTMVGVVRKRKNKLAKPYVDLICAVPKSLRYACLSFCNGTQERAKQIEILLEEPFKV